MRWVVHKLALSESGQPTIAAMPAESEILSVQLQRGVPTLWYKRPVEDRSIVDRTFVLIGTGHEHTDDLPIKYLGTVQMFSGGIVAHCFEILPGRA